MTYTRSEETTNYEVSNVKKQTISASGDLKKVTVAVIVDGFFTTNDQGEKVFNPLPADKLASLAEAVKNTVGFDEKRGDSVSVTCLEFYREENVSVWALFLLDLLREFGRPLINLPLILLFFFFVIRPIVNWLKKEVEPAGSGAEQAVLPDYPLSGGPSGDSLPLPPPTEDLRGEAQGIPATGGPGAPGRQGTASGRGALSEAEDEDYEGEEDEAPQYDDEEPEEVEEDPQRLEYGKLTRDNILPLARDNMDRTVGLLRRWIEQKSGDAPREEK